MTSRVQITSAEPRGAVSDEKSPMPHHVVPERRARALEGLGIRFDTSDSETRRSRFSQEEPETAADVEQRGSRGDVRAQEGQDLARLLSSDGTHRSEVHILVDERELADGVITASDRAHDESALLARVCGEPREDVAVPEEGIPRRPRRYVLRS